MPRLSLAGSALCGIAGMPLSIDGSTPATFAGIPSGNWDWLQSGLGVGQADFAGTGDWRLYTYDPGTTTLTEILNLNPYEANRSSAGGNVWAIWTFGGGVGVRTSITGLGPFPAGQVLSVSRQGEIVLETAYLADSGIKVYSLGGSQIDQINGTLVYNDRLYARDGVLSYALTTTGWQLRDYRALTNLGFLQRGDGIDQLIPLVEGPDIWLLERNNIEQLTLRLKDSTTAWLVGVANPNEYLYPDVMLLSPGVARIAWSNTIGEDPDTLFVMDLTLATGANDLATVVAGALVFVPQAPLGTITVSGTVIPGGGGSGGGGSVGGSGSAGTAVLNKRAAPPPSVKPARRYPHVDQIKEFPVKQSLHLAWDRMSAHADSIQSLQAARTADAKTIADLRRAVAELARRAHVTFPGVDDV